MEQAEAWARADMERIENKKKATAEESQGIRMVNLIGCPEDEGTMIPIENRMPVGAFMVVMGRVYELQQDGHLHYHAEQTKMWEGKCSI